MASIASPAVAGRSHAPLPLRARSDLSAAPQTYQGRRCWLVKDPLTLRYFRFEEEEYSLLMALDGRRGVEQLQADFARRFAPQTMSIEAIRALVGSLYRSGLVVADVPRQGSALLTRDARRRRQERRARWSSPLAVQFRGFDPARLLRRIDPLLGPLFTRRGGLAAALVMTWAAVLVASRWESLLLRLPALSDFFVGGNWLWLALALAATKVVHELGHGIACRRMGAHCHEIGVMLLVFAPCLYCNVSDAWTLPSKWRRIAVGAAGMYAELTLAAGCTLLWSFTQPGLVQRLALNVMLVSSVSTILFNANPLLRYDGYYILSDGLEVPNLRQKASALLRRWFTANVLGLMPPPDPFLPTRRRGFYLAYALAAGVYRGFLSLTIVLFLDSIFEPHGLKVVGQILGASMLYGLCVHPLIGLMHAARHSRRWRDVKPIRWMAVSLGTAAIAAAVLAIPLPTHVRCPLTLQPRGAASVYADVAGTVRTIPVGSNATVQAGQLLLELENPRIAEEVARLEGEVRAAEAQLVAAQRLAASDPRQMGEVDLAHAHRQAVAALLAQRRSDLDRLQVRAAMSGRLIAGDALPPPRDSATLAGWHGRLLDPHHVGAHVSAGTWVAQIVPPETEWEAVLVCRQGDIEFVAPGQPVHLTLRQDAGTVLRGRVDHVSAEPLPAIPPALTSAAGGSIDAIPAPNGDSVPEQPCFAVRVRLEKLPVGVLYGSAGSARIRVGSRTLGQRLWRLACQTFRFTL